MKRKTWVSLIVILLLITSNAGTFLLTSYLCCFRYIVDSSSDQSDKDIFAILIFPEDGQLNEDAAKNWFYKPGNMEWKGEFVDKDIIKKLSPETANHVACCFRLKKLDEKYVAAK